MDLDRCYFLVWLNVLNGFCPNFVDVSYLPVCIGDDLTSKIMNDI